MVVGPGSGPPVDDEAEVAEVGDGDHGPASPSHDLALDPSHDPDPRLDPDPGPRVRCGNDDDPSLLDDEVAEAAVHPALTLSPSRSPFPPVRPHHAPSQRDGPPAVHLVPVDEGVLEAAASVVVGDGRAGVAAVHGQEVGAVVVGHEAAGRGDEDVLADGRNAGAPMPHSLA